MSKTERTVRHGATTEGSQPLPRTVGGLASLVLTRGWSALTCHIQGARDGDDDPEDVHQIRVATRRLRAAMQLLGEGLPGEAQRLRGELGWLASGVGAVRDFDVLTARLASMAPADPGAAEICDRLGEQRAAARRSMLALLDSDRYTTLGADFLVLLQSLATTAGTDEASADVRDVARRLIRRRYRRLNDGGGALAPDSPAVDLHACRIRAKKLRYAVEVFVPYYGKPARRFVRALADLQDLLGRHQDAWVAVDRLKELSEPSAPSLSPRALFAAGEIARTCVDEAAALRARFPVAHARVCGKRWRRLRSALQESE